MNAALLSSVRMDWQTPDNVLALVREVFGGRIELDPCTTPENPTDALSFYTPAENGLAEPWAGQVFCNPPYGHEIEPWTRRMSEMGAAGVEIIALVPSRTDTRWWQNYLSRADAVCFWRGRLVFREARASAPFPSAIAYWGPNEAKFRGVFGERGWTP